MDPTQYTGTEWRELAKQLSKRQLRTALKRGYTAASKKAIKIAQSSLSSSGPNVQGNSSDWARGIRNYNYSKGGGFKVTVKPRGKKGFHTNRHGKQKPVLMWAEDGTKERKTRGKGFFKTGSLNRGKMPKYGFIEKAEAQMYQAVESSLLPDIEKAVQRAAAKAGFS